MNGRSLDISKPSLHKSFMANILKREQDLVGRMELMFAGSAQISRECSLTLFRRSERRNFASFRPLIRGEGSDFSTIGAFRTWPVEARVTLLLYYQIQ